MTIRYIKILGKSISEVRGYIYDVYLGYYTDNNHQPHQNKNDNG